MNSNDKQILHSAAHLLAAQAHESAIRTAARMEILKKAVAK